MPSAHLCFRSAPPTRRKKVRKQALVFADKRALAKKIMELLLKHEPAVHYAQVRPMKTNSIHTLGQLRAALKTTRGVTCDCSESSTLILRLAGFNDPNGLHFNGSGYTGTMMKHLRKIPVHKAKVGDLVVFGPYPGHHVCLVLEPGANPVLFSHGQERGPISIRLSDEARYQPSPAQFYSAV